MFGLSQDVAGALFVTVVSTAVALLTYRPERGESKLVLARTMLIAAAIAFVVSFATLYLFFRYSHASAELNVIKGPPEF